MNAKDALVESLKIALANDDLGWVLFDGGTIVLYPRGVTDPEAHAVARLRGSGGVVPGTPAGDFEVAECGEGIWFVTYDDADIITFVSNAMVVERIAPDAEISDLEVGLTGRTVRMLDSQIAKVVHVEPPGTRK